jgi:hypothetical protein
MGTFISSLYGTPVIKINMKGKLLTDQQLLGSRGIALISDRISEMGFVWRPTSDHDVGIDGEIEIRDIPTQKMSGLLIKVQSKAVTEFKNETNIGFDYWAEQRDVDYWLSVNLPIILIVSKPATDEAYWLPIKEYVQVNPTEKRFRFSKENNSLDTHCIGKILELAKSSSIGIYSPPLAKNEILICNLLHMSLLTERLYIASTDYRDRKTSFDDLKDIRCHINGDFIIKNKQIMSFCDLSHSDYNKICDQGTVENFSVEEWENSEDSEKSRDFVQLLNFCLREKLRAYNLLFNKKLKCYYFRINDDKKPYKVRYKSSIKFTDREVVKIYRKQNGKITCWRHSAMKAQFYRYDYKWYLEVTPTYIFTSDGFQQHRQHGEFITETKLDELNNAVRGQLIMWAGFLTDKGDMLRNGYPYLEFDKPLLFETNVGIEDDAWRISDQAQKLDTTTIPLFEIL